MQENNTFPTTDSTQKPIVFNIWSYSGDQEKIVYCAKALRRIWKTEDIFIWDDFNSPMCESTLGKLKKMHCLYNTTKYPRKGNLIGGLCMEGMMANYIESAKCGTKYISKVDPDTLVLQEIEFGGNGCFGKGANESPYCGFYYFDSRLVKLFEIYLQSPEYRANLIKKPYFLDKKRFGALEDYSFYHLANYFFKDGVGFEKEGFWGTTDKNPIKNFGTRNQDKKDMPERMAKTLRNLN